MWPVFSLQFNFGFLINHAVEDVALITLYIYQYCTNFSVLGFIWKLWIRALRKTLHHVNVPSIQLAMQFRVFGKSCRRRGTSNQFVYLPILAHFQCSWAHLNAMNYSFQMNPWSCKCGQYSACNSISGFWVNMQEGRTNQFMYLPIL